MRQQLAHFVFRQLDRDEHRRGGGTTHRDLAILCPATTLQPHQLAVGIGHAINPSSACVSVTLLAIHLLAQRVSTVGENL